MKAWMLLGLVLAALIGPPAAFAQDATPVPTATPTATPPADLPPANDAFASPITLSAAQPRAVGSTALATIETGEPAHYSVYRARSVWFDYTPDRDRRVAIDTCGSDFDTVLAVYTGSELTSLTRIASNDDSACGTASRISFVARAGVRYRIALDGYNGAYGAYRITLDESDRPPNDDQSDAIVLADSETGTTINATAEPGEPLHADVGGGHSVWYYLDVYATGPARVTVDTCDADFDTVLAVYTDSYGGSQEVASNDDAPAVCGDGSTGSAITFTTTRYTGYVVAVDGKNGATGSFTIKALTNDDRYGARYLNPGDALLGDNTAATREPGEALHAGDPGGHSLWYRTGYLEPGRRVEIDTCDPIAGGLDTVLGVYLDGYGGLVELGANDDTLGCGLAGRGSRVSLTSPGGELLIAIDGKGGATGSFRVRLTARPLNDDRVDAIPWSSLGLGISTQGATAEPGEPAHAGVPAEHSLWYRLARPAAGGITLTACAYDTGAQPRLAVYADDGLQDVVTSRVDGSCGYGNETRVSFRADGVKSYLIALDGPPSFYYVGSLQPPANDDFARASSFPGWASGTIAQATAEPGEPEHAGAPARSSVWYRYDVPAGGSRRITLTTCDSAAVPLRLGVYRGTALENLAEVASGTAGSGGCANGNGAIVTWTRANPDVPETYWIAVDAAGTGTGYFYLSATTPPENDDRANAYELYGGRQYGTTVGATREAGEPDHGGAGGRSSVWYRWTAGQSGPVQFDTCAPSYTNAADTVIAVYTESPGGELVALDANDDSPLCADPRRSVVRFDATAGTRYWLAVDTPRGVGYFGLRLAQRPGNDDRADAYSLGDYVRRVSVALDFASAETGEPAHGGVAAAHSAWYRWRTGANGPVTIDTCESSVDSVLALYTEHGGELEPVAANDDAPGCGTSQKSSRVTFPAVAGTEYWIAVDAKSALLDDVMLRLPSPYDHFAGAYPIAPEGETVYSDLANGTAEPGEPAHAGVPAQSSEWFTWTPSRSAVATIDECDYGATRVGVYTGDAVSALTPVPQLPVGGCAYSGSRTRFAAVAGTTYRIAVDTTNGSAGYHRLWTYLAPVNDQRADATPVSGETTYYSSTAGASREADEPDHAGVGGQATVWYAWTPARSATAVIDTCLYSGFDTAIAVYAADGTPLAANDDSACGIASRVRLHVDADATYYVAVTGKGAAEGSFGLRFTQGPYNDDFANAVAVSGTTTGTTVAAGHETGEPSHGGTGTDHSVWYRVTRSDTRNVELRACPRYGSTPPVLAAYTGTSLMTLLPVGAATTRTIGGVTCRVLALRAMTGTRYVAVDGEELDFDLTVAVAPLNDDRASAQSVTGAGEVFGTTLYATAEDGEDAHAGAPAAHSVWYRWTPARSGPVAIDTCASSLDTVLAVYRDAGTLEPVAASDDAGCGTVGFSAEAGTAYLIAVDGAEGGFTLGFPPANDLFDAAATLSGALDEKPGTTLRATAQPGEPAHAGAAASRSVWYAWTPPRSGRVTLSTCLESSAPTRIALYRGTSLATLALEASAQPAAGCASGRGAQLRTRVEGGVPYRIAVDASAAGTFRLLAALAPENDDRADARVVPAAGIVSGSTDYATAEAGEPAHAGRTATSSVWFAVTPERDGPLSVKTCAASFDTVLAVYRGSAVTPIASADDGADSCGARRASLTFDAVAGTRYEIALDGRAGATGTYELSVGAPVNDDFQHAIALTGTRASGTSTTVAATTQAAEPQGGLFYSANSVWWTWTASSSGIVEVNTCGSQAGATLSVYRGTALSGLTSVNAHAPNTCEGATGARISFNAEAGVGYAFSITSWLGNAGPVRIQVDPPTNDWFSTPQALSGLEAEAAGTLAGTSAESGEPAHVTGGARRTLWYAYTAAQDGRLTIDTCGSATSVAAAIYRGTALGALQRVNPNGSQAECPSDAPGTSVTVAAEAGTQYRIALDGTSDRVGETHLRLRLRVDEIPPTTTIGEKPPARTNTARQTFTFTADEPEVRFECRLDGGAFTACSSPVEYVDRPEGAHVFEVRGTDAAGNVEPVPARHEFTIDRTPPVLTIDAAPPALGRERTVAVAFSSPESSATFECSVDGVEFAVCTSPLSLEDLEDGSHTVRVRALDDLPNTSAAQTASFRVDTRPPVSRFATAPPALGNVRSATFTFSADEPSTFECRVDDGAFGPCGSPVELTDVAEGEHAFTVRATDTAGNVESDPPVHRWRVDTTPPATSVSAAPAAPVRAVPAFTLTSNESPERFECAVDGGSFAACGSPFAPTVADDGEHVLRVRAVDAAGNVDATPVERRFTLDRTPPEVTLDGGPDGPTREAVATFAFHASETVDRYECELGGASVSCANGAFTSAPLADGTYRFRVRAVDLAGNVGAYAERAFTVDATAPKTRLTTVPHDPTNAATPVVEFRSEEGATFACSLDGAPFAACESPWSLPGLAEGDHTVRVRATDRAGNVELEPVEHVFEIDRTPPDTSIPVYPTEPFHEGAIFRVQSSEDGRVECQIDDDEWKNCTPGVPYVVDMIGKAPGVHTFRARARDAADNVDPTPAERPFTFLDEAPVVTATVTPDKGAANLDVAATIAATDADDDRLDYEVDWGDGTNAVGALPLSGALAHTYGRAGLYVVRIEVSDGYVSTVVSRTVTVVLPEPLVADAGDDQTVVAGEPVNLDGGGTRPLVGVESYRWDFGDGESASGAVVTHTYAEPGTYTARLTVRGGAQTDADEATVTVLPSSQALGVLATVTSGGLPLAGADVLVILPDGGRVSAVSDSLGQARLRGLPEGQTRVLAYRAGHLPSSATATVAADGTGAVTIELKAGEVAKAEVSSRRLTLQEILDLGIDPDDPANQHSFTFTVNLQLEDRTVQLSGSGSGGPGGAGGGGGGGGFWGVGGTGLECRRLACKGTVGGVTVFVTYHELAPGVPGLTTLIIPFKARWLKEFFDVSMTVTNLADPEFVLRDGAAMLDLPPGLSLAPTARGEHLTQPVEDIPGGQSRTANWIIRGDKEGEYRFGANYGARLEPFGSSVSIRGEMDEPLKVWGGSALNLIVDVDQQVRNGYPFHVRVGLENVSDVPVYNPGVELLKDGRRGYIEQPRQQREFTAPEIAAGETFWAGPFILVPNASGDVDLADSFIKKIAGDVDLKSAIVTHDRVPPLDETPKLRSHPRLNAVVFDYDPIPGATDYKIFGTPDRETDFPLEPLPQTQLKPGKTKVLVDPGSKLSYAVSTTHDSRPEMIHPLASDEASSVEIWPSTETTAGACGKTEQSVTVTLEDPDYDLTQWRYKVDSSDWQTEPLSGSTAERTLRVELSDAPAKVVVQAQNTEQQAVNAWGPEKEVTVARCRLVAIGDSVSAGEGIGYGYEWNNTTKRWEDKTGANETWDDDDRPADCHQTAFAHPRVLAEMTGMTLVRHLSCTGATVDEGLKEKEPDKHDECRSRPCQGPQLGGFAGGSATNEKYLAAKPDVVTLSIGANDIYFGKVVGTCFYPLTWVLRDGTCDGRLDDAENLLNFRDIADKFDETYDRIAAIGREVGRRPMVLHTQYINPFPDAGEDDSCFDIQGAAGSGFSRVEINRMVAGLKKLNGLIESEAKSHPGVVSVPANPEFDQHRFCSEDPWIFGMDTAIDWHTDKAFKAESPFHPTIDGQKAIARQVKQYLDAAVVMDHAGTDKEIKIPTGETVRFEKVDEPGTVLVVRVSADSLPVHPGFDVRQGYQVDTSALFSGSVQIQLPAQPGDKMWHYHDGAWEQVPATFDGTQLTGSVSSFSPFAVGPDAAPVSARITAGSGGVAPIDIAFSAAGSVGPVHGVEWDFGDGGTATGVEASHRYLYSGTFDVTATVRGVDGGVDRATTTVTVTNPAPRLAASVPATAKVGDTVQLDSRASTDSNGTIRDGWWELAGALIEPGAQLTELRLDTPGTVTVEAVVRDNELNEARKTFTIEVAPAGTDTTPPVISGVPTDVESTATGAAGAVVEYALPTAVDDVDGGVAVTCDPPSGATFAVGTTTVSCRAVDRSGNEAVRTFRVTVRVAPVEVEDPVMGSVPPTLALTIGSLPSFGTFVPGVARDYTTGTTVTVTSTAAEAQLTVGDPSADAPGHLVNGTFALAEPLLVGTEPVGTASAPTVLRRYAAPVGVDGVEVGFRQRIQAGDPLRAGTYSKTLVFNLSTTTP